MLKNTIEYKRFVWELNNIINVQYNINTTIIFLCIGTNRIIGDAFGPVVGTVLKDNLPKNNNVQVLGDLKQCITYDNINKNVQLITSNYQANLIIVLDSALSYKNDIGKVFIQNRGLKYAESLEKKNSVIGNISIKAVVGENKFNKLDNFQNLKNVSVKQIYNMCSLVSNGIIDVMNKKEKYGKNIYK